MADNVHKGHRERLRKKFIDEGLDAFNDHQVLEYILFYAIPYRDTNPLAHKLLEEYGSLSAVFDAKPQILKAAGYSDNVIGLIKLIPEISRRYHMDKTQNRSKIVEQNQLCEYFEPRFIGKTNEILYLLLLDSKSKEVFSGIISQGTVNESSVPVRKIIQLAMTYDATSAVIAHNHPGGMALPSLDDIRTTKIVTNALGVVGIDLIDHVIVSDDDSISLRDSLWEKQGIFIADSEV